MADPSPKDPCAEEKPPTGFRLAFQRQYIEDALVQRQLPALGRDHRRRRVDVRREAVRGELPSLDRDALSLEHLRPPIGLLMEPVARREPTLVAASAGRLATRAAPATAAASASAACAEAPIVDLSSC